MDTMNYERMVRTISKISGLDITEIEQRIEAKKEKISGLISNEGAAQIVAAELSVSFDNEKLKINELSSDMKRVNVIGKIINLSPVRTFTRNNQESKVANFIIADETSNTRVVLWDTNHIVMIEEGKIKVDSVVEISNANVRGDEVHLGSFSELKLSDEILENVRTEKIVKEKNIFDLKISSNVSVRAFIVQIFDPRFFNVCIECKKKVIPEGEGFVCSEHGKVVNEKKALINIVLDDGTETIRAVLFHERISDLGIDDLENTENLNRKKQELLGKEMIFSGSVRMNKFFDNHEFIVDGVKETNIDELIEKLEKN
ncbi:MAG: hypothetical protein IIA85_03140 [Nanoarchaeota archaeon]|nr:hypothetical protein [Nanoarchaeota archaeon]